MRLLSKYNRLLLLVSLTGLLCIGFLFYRALGYFLDQKIDESLNEEYLEVQDFAHVKNITPAPSEDKDLVITYWKARKLSFAKEFGDTTYFNPKKQQTESARYLKTGVDLNGTPLNVLVITSRAQVSDQIRVIFMIIFVPLIILFGLLYLINRYLLTRLWQPFGRVLSQIQDFDVNRNQPFEEVKTDILEFSQLNFAVSKMIRQINDDFTEVKLFTENASHEMMTPIAIINSKLDTILQSPTLQENDSQSLHELYKATSRLSKINQSLLLLVKIDSNLLEDYHPISVKDLITAKADYYTELLKKRQLSLQISADTSEIYFSRPIFDIILNNLFSNAIRHNSDAGKIDLRLDRGVIQVRNTGVASPLNANRILERFYKSPDSEGTGLGLAILHQIVKKYQLKLDYSFVDQLHCFKVDLSSLLMNKDSFSPPYDEAQDQQRKVKNHHGAFSN